MTKLLRVIIIVAVFIGILGFAQSQVAWAANSAEQTDQTTLQTVERTASLDKGDYCDKPWNKRKEECKDKDKDKDKCKKNPHHCGTVKPPPGKIIIPVTGEYSVGGLCTLSVEFNDADITLDARIKFPLPRVLPRKVQNLFRGCLLTYSRSGQRINELPPDLGNTVICFAAIPKKQMTLYFYDIYSPNPKWMPLETTVQDGKACAAGNGSGVYVATFTKP